MAKNFINKLDEELQRRIAESQGPIPSLKAPSSITQFRIEKTGENANERTKRLGGGTQRKKNIIDGSAEVNVDRDRSIINEFESMPDYTAKQRNEDFWSGMAQLQAGQTPDYTEAQKRTKQYNDRQAMVDEYNAAKNRQITKALDNYTGDADIPMLAGANANAIFHPLQYSKAQQNIQPYLEQNGITLDQLADYYRTQALAQQNKDMAAFAKEHPVLGTGASFVTNQIGNAATGLDALAAYTQGKPIGTNQSVNEYGKLTPTIRGTVREGIKANADTDLGGAIGAGAYDVLTSLGDMGMALALGGGNQAATLGLMSYGAGAQNLNEQKGRGTTADQMMATAVSAGLIEALTEAIPLDNLFKMANNKATRATVKQVLKNVLSQAGQEATEEAISEIANAFMDNAINGEKSDYAQAVQTYVNGGLSEEEAKTKARLDVLANAGYSALIGGITGGIMGAGGSVVGNARYNYNNIDDGVRDISPSWDMRNMEEDNGRTISREQFNQIPNINGLIQNNETGLNNQNQVMDKNVPWANSEEFRNPASEQLVNDLLANWNEGYLDDGTAYLRPSDAMKSRFVDRVLEENGRSFPFLDDADSDILRRIPELNEGRRMANPNNVLDEDIDTELSMNLPQDGRSMANPNLNWNQGNYRNVDSNFENRLDPDNINWKRGRYKSTNPNFEDNGNAVPTLNKQADASWARDFAEAEAQNTPEIEIDIPQLKEKKSKRQRDKVMKEDLGLNPRTNAEYDAEMQNAKQRGDEMVIDLGMSDDDADAVSQVATNTFMNNIDEFQSPEAQEILQEDIENGVYDKANLNERNYGQNVMHNEWLDNKSDDWIQNHADELEQRLANGEAVYDRSILQAGIKMAKEAATNGDWDRFRYLNQKIASSGNNAGSILNVFAQESARDAATAAVKTDALIRDANDRYFKKHKKQREGCSRLATALKNIGNDYTQIKAKPIPTYDQILRGVDAELGRESSSVFDNFNDQDKAYIANMVQKGYSAKELQLKLEQRLTTGHWDISDADLDRVNSLLEEARQYDDKSKKAAELDAQACAILAEYLPNTSFYEKWNAWRYLAMLGNPRTHMRNILGNMMFGQVLETTSDKVGAILEGVGQGLGVIDKSQRTKTLRTASRSFKQAAKADLMEHAYTDLTDEGNKYSNLKKGIAGQQKVFGNKNAFQRGMSKVNDVAGGLLTLEDERALIRKYDQAVTNFLMSRGYNESIFNATDEKSQAVLEQAREYGIRRAKEATFHEDSKFANWWNQTSKNAHESESIAANLGGYAMDSLMPFVKTPANVLKMSIKYTPANVLNALYNADNPTKAIEEIARAMTGSSIIALGMFLRSHGMLRTRGDDDEKQLDKVTGQQDFSLNVNGKSYTLDWLSPAAVPLFIGSELYQQYVENEDLDVGKVLEAVADPVTEMSMLQGINNTIEAIAKNRQQETPAGQLLADIGFGYASQAIPTLAGQVARTFDNTRRNSYYTGKEGTSDQFIQYAKKAAAKIPGLSSTLEPFVNAWGQEDKNNDVDNFWGRMLLNTLSPGYYSNVESDATEQELYRLNKATNGAVKNNLPKMAESKPLDGMDKLSAQDYTEWSKISGQNQKELYDEAIKSSYYNSLNDAEKNSMLTQIRNFSKALSLDEFTEGKDLNGLEYNIEDKSDYKKQYEAYKRNGVQGLVDYIELSDKIKKAYKGDGRTSASKADVINALDSMNDISQEDKIEYLKLKKDYTKRGQYIDQFINPKYAYDWFRVEAMAGDKKDDRMYAIYTMDIPDLEKQVLLSVLNMKDDEIQYHLTTGK